MILISQIVVLKKKKKIGEKLTQEQKLALRALQLRKFILNLEEYLIIISFVIGGVLARTFMQGFPSVEPITFFAILTGSLFGWKKGMAAGASAWYLSNFFMFGGQGPWTIIQVMSGALAGYLGSFVKGRLKYAKAFLAIFIATIFFEITMNIGSGFFFGFGVIVSFFSAMPFIFTHIVSNLGFAALLPKVRSTVLKYGRLNEKELCTKLIHKIKNMKKKDEE